ncbi:FAD:protein FMN transferase [Eudoraea adriatica]|uniref:FAD:protein FMN transferase n=1 Tax=Eudoraea adriatica TaxID=446681 RepID=UPI0003821C86|nr:FAD:protein FMN transferase [Eudoraea adriatica]
MMDLLKYSSRFLIFTFFLATIVCCNPGPDSYVKNMSFGGALGTSYSITYLTERELDIQSEIDSVFEVINHSMSTYIPDSDISKINNGDATVRVDQMFREVFELSQEVHANTNGYFDPTVGALVNAWGFGPGDIVKMDSSKVDSILQFVGLDKVRLNSDGTITKKDPRIFMDFNAIAKGYAIDRLAILLDQKDIGNYLIEVGGEIISKGENKIKNKSWIVGIDDPQIEEGRRLKLTLQLADKAMASSGNYRKFRVDSITGQKYVHTIDPKTGYTRDSQILAVSVIANSCAKADAYATAMMAMELPESKKVLNQQEELDAYIIYLEKDGEVAEFMTPGFKKLVVR